MQEDVVLFRLKFPVLQKHQRPADHDLSPSECLPACLGSQDRVYPVVWARLGPGQASMGGDWTRLEGPGQDGRGQDGMGQGRAGWEGPGQEGTGQGKMGGARTGGDRAGQDRAGLVSCT